MLTTSEKTREKFISLILSQGRRSMHPKPLKLLLLFEEMYTFFNR